MFSECRATDKIKICQNDVEELGAAVQGHLKCEAVVKALCWK